MPRQPTRADVARLAGVSSAVVSYVVNNGPRPVSADARRRVTHAIDALGYRPNQVAKALRANRSLSVGLLLPDTLNPFFWELTQHLEQACLDRGYMLFIGTTNNDAELERHYLNAFEDRQVDGMIVVSATPDWEASALGRTPCVLIDRSPTPTARAVAQSDNARGAELAVEHLLAAHDRSHVLILAGPESFESTRARAAGARAALAAGPGVASTTTHSAFSFAEGYAAVSAEFERGVAFDAIFAFSDVQAIGAIRACADAGRRVPDDIAVVAFDGTELTRFTSPRITSVEQDISGMATAAMEHLLRLISDGSAEVAPVIGMPRLRVEESCGCGTQRSATKSAAVPAAMPKEPQ